MSTLKDYFLGLGGLGNYDAIALGAQAQVIASQQSNQMRFTSLSASEYLSWLLQINAGAGSNHISCNPMSKNLNLSQSSADALHGESKIDVSQIEDADFEEVNN